MLQAARRAPAPAGAARGAGADRVGARRLDGRGPPPLLTVALSVVAGENRYSQTAIEARPGQRVEIAFTNARRHAAQRHVLKPGATTRVVKDIIALAVDPTAQNRGYVPDSPNVLFSLNLVPAHQSAVLEFVAPIEPGEYPFVCTFPGHWVTMRGVLVVK